MNCVTSVIYSIRINDVPHGRITPSRGLRQGDPLSPYLFLLCAKSLSALIHNAASWFGTLRVFRFASEVLTSLICSSLMIAYSFVMLQLLIAKKSKDC